jgi:hypothetical protein
MLVELFRAPPLTSWAWVWFLACGISIGHGALLIFEKALFGTIGKTFVFPRNLQESVLRLFVEHACCNMARLRGPIAPVPGIVEERFGWHLHPT